MRNDLNNPPWRAEDLGLAIPDSPHAVSVSLPLWEHVIGYEENDPAVLAAMRTGYPRFFIPRVVLALCAEVEKCFAREGERGLVFPNPRAAGRCRDFIVQRHDGWEVRVVDSGFTGITVVFFAEPLWDTARRYWRFCGEIVSTRQAAAALEGRPDNAVEGSRASASVRGRLASISKGDPDDVYLFPSGMAAVGAVHRMLLAVAPGLRTVQFDFPYVDVLKIQEEFGDGVRFHPVGNTEAESVLAEMIAEERFAGVFCEMPSNPLLRSVNLPVLRSLCRGNGAALIVDDTVGTNVNVATDCFADVVTTSLTKSFSGIGDVMAGAVTLVAGSPHYAAFKAYLDAFADGGLWWEDAVALDSNSRDYAERVSRMNGNAEALCEFLRAHPGVAEVNYPKWRTRDCYDAVRRSDGGYGPLFSLVLRDPERTSAAFYDALRVAKGPSLGTNYTLVCPYTLLAHYHELDWAESCGVSRWLIRVSTGLESIDDLIERFGSALAAAELQARGGSPFV
jgi:cystathionine gamma-synthase